MNILQLNDVLHTLCMKVPTVNSYYSQDVYEAWNTSEVKYASMAFNLMNTLQTDTTRNFEGVIYYADRLTEDKSNRLHIFADADNAISGVLFNLEDSSDDGEFSISDFQIMHFKQNFADFLAGGYAHITIKVANDCDIVLLQKKLERIINITENGVYDVTNYTTAVVDVIPRWGAIQGNIEEQEDLMNLFGNKLDKTTNVSVIYGTDSEGNQIEYTAGEGIILENGQIINTSTSPAPSEEIIEHLDEIKNKVDVVINGQELLSNSVAYLFDKTDIISYNQNVIIDCIDSLETYTYNLSHNNELVISYISYLFDKTDTISDNQNLIINNQNTSINTQTQIMEYVSGLDSRVNEVLGNQNMSNEVLLTIVDNMNRQYDVNVKAFNNLGDKLDQIIENTKGGIIPPPYPPEPDPEPTPQPEPTPHSKVPQFETLIVKTSKNGISSDGCWYFDDRYSTLKNAVGKLKLDGSKEIIPAENAIITTTIKYKDGRTGNYQVWNGGFEYNAPYNYKKSKSYTTVQKSRTTTPKQKTVVKSVVKNTKSTSHNIPIWNISKPVQNEQPKVVNNEVSVTPKKQTRNQVAITTTNPTIWYSTQNKPKIVTPKPIKHKKSAPVISVVEKTRTDVKPQISKAELKEWRNTWWKFIQAKVNEQDIPKCMGPLSYRWELEPHWIKLKNRISEYENKIKELQQKNSLLNMREINEIIVHCSATVEGKDFTVADITKWHKQKGYDTIGYHYVIYRDGSIHAGRDLDIVGAHCKGHNAYSIGVCYVGGLAADGKTAKDTRTPAQKEALLKLLKALNEVFPATKHNIFGHRDFANKACPSFDATMEYNEL